ncbi:hypothetical protein PINS_up000962 [Pythium insidiosum]|nr:hypothetical protein PINS_up000962 [Pythium insidiosum]
MWLLPNAPYSLITKDLNPDGISKLLTWALIQATVELGSFLALALALRRHFGLSALSQMAFVQATYWRMIQGKVIGSVLVVVNLVSLHQGMMH